MYLVQYAAFQNAVSRCKSEIDKNTCQFCSSYGQTATALNISSSASVPELQNHVSELETRVSEETRRRMSLEDEVRRLNDENRKLRDQAQAAVNQLRKFTEWFFKNVQRQ